MSSLASVRRKADAALCQLVVSVITVDKQSCKEAVGLTIALELSGVAWIAGEPSHPNERGGHLSTRLLVNVLNILDLVNV